MVKSAFVDVLIDGSSVSNLILPRLTSLSVMDKAGTSSDTCSFTIDNTSGRVMLPRENAKIEVKMGWIGAEIVSVFQGNVDMVRASGGMQGRSIGVDCKGLDTSGKVKQPQRRTFRNQNVQQMLNAAGQFAGINRVLIAQEIAAISRVEEVLDNESFVAFGERLARELGGTFKVRNDAAVMVVRGAGKAPTGADLPDVPAIYGVNLHSWDVAPYVGRHRYKKIVVRYYDPASASHLKIEVETDIDGSDAEAIGNFTAPNRELAEQKAQSLKQQSESRSGAGSVKIEGAPGAQPEAAIDLQGTGTDADGRYRIDSVGHTYGESGFETSLTLRNRIS
jgi:phage protein D